MSVIQLDPAKFWGELDSKRYFVDDVVLYVSSYCNLRCQHCYVGNELLDQGRRYRLEDVVALFKLAPSELSRVTILGGEPLLYRGISKVVAASLNCSKLTRLTTNLSISPNTVRLLPADGLEVAVSLDGHDASSHDEIRGKGNFDLVCKNLKSIVAQGFNVEVSHTVTARNINHFPALVELLKAMGVRRLNLHKVSHQGNAKDNTDLDVSPEDWMAFTDTFNNHVTSSPKIAVRFPRLFIESSKYDEFIQRSSYHAHSSGSFYGQKNRIVVYPNGDLFISSEAFGTNARIGRLSDGMILWSQAGMSELSHSNDSSNLEAINPDIAPKNANLKMLSFSFKEHVTL